MSRKEILLIIPAYNEEMNIGIVLDGLRNNGILEKMDVLVIDDGSADDTFAVAKSRNVEVIRQCFNMGYGAALQTGYKYAVKYGYQYLLQMDADGQHDLRNLERICDKLGCGTQEVTGRVPDIVIGSRFLDGSQTFRVSGLRMFAIHMFRGAIHWLTGYRLTDPTSGLQGLNKKAFSYYAGYSNFDVMYPDLNMIIQMLLLGYHIEEVPAIMHQRVAGVSMHTGLLHAGRYMVLMALSTFNVFVRCRGKLARK